MSKVLKFQRPGAVEVEISVMEDGKCISTKPDQLTLEQKRRLARGLRKLQTDLLNRAKPSTGSD